MNHETDKHWQVVTTSSNESKQLMRRFTFPDYKQTIQFVNQVAEVAERLKHHPKMTVSWGEVTIALWTHSESAITDKDYLLAKEIDTLTQ